MSEAGGPLRVSNSHPLFHATGNPILRSVTVEDSFGVFFNYSSIFLLEESSDWSAVIDAEIAVLEFELNKLLDDSTEVGLTIPLMSYNSGFLDGFLESFHDLAGVPNYGRERRPDDDFAFSLSRDGKELIIGESGEFALGDIRVGIKRILNSYSGVYCFLDLPIGDPDKGYGNGMVDWGAALLMEKTFPSGIEAYLNAGLVVVGDYRGLEDFDLDNYPYGGLGIGWNGENLSLKTQFMASGSPFQTGIRELDTASLIWSVGGEYRMADVSMLGLSFSEDVNTAGAPDFMLIFEYRYLFGKKAMDLP